MHALITQIDESPTRKSIRDPNLCATDGTIISLLHKPKSQTVSMIEVSTTIGLKYATNIGWYSVIAEAYATYFIYHHITRYIQGKKIPINRHLLLSRQGNFFVRARHPRKFWPDYPFTFMPSCLQNARRVKQRHGEDEPNNGENRRIVRQKNCKIIAIQERCVAAIALLLEVVEKRRCCNHADKVEFIFRFVWK